MGRHEGCPKVRVRGLMAVSLVAVDTQAWWPPCCKADRPSLAGVTVRYAVGAPVSKIPFRGATSAVVDVLPPLV